MKAFVNLWYVDNCECISDVIADKGYDCSEIRILIRQAVKDLIITRKQCAVRPGVQDKDKENTQLDLILSIFSEKLRKIKG